MWIRKGAQIINLEKVFSVSVYKNEISFRESWDQEDIKIISFESEKEAIESFCKIYERFGDMLSLG